jgi:hypothetical protein
MKKLNHILTVAGIATTLLVSAGSVLAQPQDQGRSDRGRGNFDPEQMRQRMMDGVMERLEITNDAERKAIEPLVTKVFEARRDAMSGGRSMFGRGPGGPGGSGGPGGPGGDRGGDRGRSFFGEPSAAAQALQKAIESKASKDELKAAMAKYREDRKAKEAALKEAQENLRKVLTLRQEAIALENNYLD